MRPGFLLVLLLLAPGHLVAAEVANAKPGADVRPNIVFIGAEDLSPDLACYGSKFVHTPNLDRLASQGARFTRAFTHAPVCAPSRSGMITGMYPTTIGSHHMRSGLINPPPTFPAELRKAGYYVDWATKTDINFAGRQNAQPKDAFDSTKAWTNDAALEKLPRPFFAHVNFATTHESQIRAPRDKFEQLTRRLTPAQRMDPAKVDLPPYYPDTPESRRDLANYYELVTAMDYQVGEVLDLLERHKLADNTVVVFWGDHGRGLPRYKRWCYDSGTRIPLIVRWPGKVQPGTVRDDLVAVVDFAPTFLTMAGAPIPDRMQGQPFLTGEGKPNPHPRKYVYAARDRMDETPDRIRSVRDERYHYVRNFRPELPYAQRIQYGEEMPTMQSWRRLNAEGKLTGPQKLFFAPTKPKEELYDTASDPHEVNNLADSRQPEHQAKLKELRGELDRWIDETKDLGAVPEEELIKQGLVEDFLKNYLLRKEPSQ
jgi:N-sulfoglucosamine sulfohydrolase